MVKEDGNLELDFSTDYGESYYTKNEKVCPYSYIAQKGPDDIEGRGRALGASGMIFCYVGGATVFMIETTDGGTKMSAAESVVVATDKFENNHDDCLSHCHDVCAYNYGYWGAKCQIECDNECEHRCMR